MGDFIVRYWLQILFGLLAGAFGSLYARAKVKADKQKAELEALKADFALLKRGQRVSFRHEITKSFHYHMKQGRITDDDLMSFLDMCEMYYALDGNGVVQRMESGVKKLKVVDAVAESI